jgi:hypothetical protein
LTALPKIANQELIFPSVVREAVEFYFRNGTHVEDPEPR